MAEDILYGSTNSDDIENSHKYHTKTTTRSIVVVYEYNSRSLKRTIRYYMYLRIFFSHSPTLTYDVYYIYFFFFSTRLILSLQYARARSLNIRSERIKHVSAIKGVFMVVVVRRCLLLLLLLLLSSHMSLRAPQFRSNMVMTALRWKSIFFFLYITQKTIYTCIIYTACICTTSRRFFRGARVWEGVLLDGMKKKTTERI